MQKRLGFECFKSIAVTLSLTYLSRNLSFLFISHVQVSLAGLIASRAEHYRQGSTFIGVNRHMHVAVHTRAITVYVEPFSLDPALDVQLFIGNVLEAYLLFAWLDPRKLRAAGLDGEGFRLVLASCHFESSFRAGYKIIEDQGSVE